MHPECARAAARATDGAELPPHGSPSANPSSGGAATLFERERDAVLRYFLAIQLPEVNIITFLRGAECRRTDARSLRRATKHLFACRPRCATARRWGWTLSTPPPTTKLLIECRDRRRPARPRGPPRPLLLTPGHLSTFSRPQSTAPGQFSGMGASRKQLKGIFLNLASWPLS